MFGMTTRRKAMATGIKVPSVHGIHKGVDPHVKPEHQKPKAPAAPTAHKQTVSVPRPPRPEHKISRKLVEQSKAMLYRKDKSKELRTGCSKTPTNPLDPFSLPASSPLIPTQHWPRPPVHLPPFMTASTGSSQTQSAE